MTEQNIVNCPCVKGEYCPIHSKQDEGLLTPKDKIIRCPKCKSRHYYYEGHYIECNSCGYKIMLPGCIIPKDWMTRLGGK